MNIAVRLLPCILGLIACSLPIFWGHLSLATGICHNQGGAILGGVMSLAFGSIIFVIIIVTVIEQIMNDTDPFADIEEIDIDEDRL